MASQKEILDELAVLSDRISTQVRTVALSVIATVWLFVVGGKDAPLLPHSPDKSWLLAAGALCLLALLFDYLQYLAGYKCASALLNAGPKAGAAEKDAYKYNRTAFTWRARRFFFIAKQLLLICGFCALTWTLGRALFS
jgi:hypothetical protein